MKLQFRQILATIALLLGSSVQAAEQPQPEMPAQSLQPIDKADLAAMRTEFANPVTNLCGWSDSTGSLFFFTHRNRAATKAPMTFFKVNDHYSYLSEWQRMTASGVARWARGDMAVEVRLQDRRSGSHAPASIRMSADKGLSVMFERQDGFWSCGR